MARLNDFTAPPESIEALKRRFVRQNREIARVNSLQSLRIRSLESEVSHLLAENVSLREQVINLTNDIDRLEAAKSLSDGVYEIKSRLDSKLAELNTIASDLGLLPRKASKLNNGQLAQELNRPKAAAPESRARASDPEIDDGRLPAILEDKYYPRRTLEHQEIQDLVEADTSALELSNDLHLTHNQSDCGGESPTPKVSEDRSNSEEDDTTSDAYLPPTLETRKKKKKLASTTSMPEDTTPEESTPSIEHTQAAKSGSKRKFIPDDDGFISDLAPEDDEFQFSRPTHTPRKEASPFEMVPQESSPSKTPTTMEQPAVNPVSAKRKVLEPKSANANLGSPKKARSLQADKKSLYRAGNDENRISPQKPKELLNHKPRRPSQITRGSRPVSGSPKAKRSSRSVGMEEMAHNQLAPVLLENSPMAQSRESLTGVSDGSRPSRRRGAVVSYAEPNLRAKMRRPTKDMIDAVANHESRRSSSFQLVQENLSDETDKSSGEKCSLPGGNVPADFALAGQATDLLGENSSQGVTNVSQRRRKVSLATKDDDASATADVLAAEVSNLEDLRSTASKQSSRRQPRRHSSNPKSTARHVSPVRGGGDIGGEPQSPSSSQSPTHLASFSQSNSTWGEDDAGWKNPPTTDTEVRRETRVAARRRSMMV